MDCTGVLPAEYQGQLDFEAAPTWQWAEIAMTIQHIASIEDPRLEPYRDLRNRHVALDQGMFVAEGRWLAVRLLQSEFQLHSVLVEHRRIDDVAPWLRDNVPLYVIPDKAAPSLVGFDFHRGVLACGVRPAPKSVSDLSFSERSTVVMACRLQDPENVGLILRNCAAFGVEAMILGPKCIDPYARRVLRVSMGNAFFTPIAVVDSLETTIADLQRLGFDVAATVLDDTAERLPKFRRRPRQALIFGEESSGITAAGIEAASRTVTLPMAGGADSLNVAVAAGVFLYHIEHAGE